MDLKKYESLGQGSAMSNFMLEEELKSVLEYNLHSSMFFKKGAIDNSNNINIYDGNVNLYVQNDSGEYQYIDWERYLSADSNKIIDSGAVVLYKDNVKILSG